MMKIRGGAVAAALKGELVQATFDIDSMRKDMRTMLEEADARGVELPLVAGALTCYDACSEAGYGDPAMETAPWVGRGTTKS
jgi:3-hydroxyisobutyrate dehydrogenase